METTNYLPVIGLLVLAVVVTLVLLRIMRSRHHGASERRAGEARAEADPPVPAPAPSKLSKEEQEYLDSSHISGPIAPGGRDALETWRSNKRK